MWLNLSTTRDELRQMIIPFDDSGFLPLLVFPIAAVVVSPTDNPTRIYHGAGNENSALFVDENTEQMRKFY